MLVVKTTKPSIMDSQREGDGWKLTVLPPATPQQIKKIRKKLPRW